MSFFSRNINSKDRHKIQIISNSTAPSFEPNNEFVTSSCCCCGTLLQHPKNISKFRCSVCYVTVTLQGTAFTQDKTELFDLEAMRELLSTCDNTYRELDKDEKRLRKHEVFHLLEDYIATRMVTIFPLNASFESTNPREMLDYDQVKEFYRMLMELPTKKPFYAFLVACNELLKRPHVALNTPTPADPKYKRIGLYRWILIILEVPIFKQTLANAEARCNTPHFRAISYEVLKKAVGYMSCLDEPSAKELVHFLKYMHKDIFVSKVELVNMYITFHFARILHTIGKETNAGKYSPQLEDFENSEKLNPSLNHASAKKLVQNNMNMFFGGIVRPIAASANTKDILALNYRFSPEDYGNEWHIKTGARLLLCLYVANQSAYKCPVSNFYNTMIDFVDYKRDFELWQDLSKLTPSHEKENSGMPGPRYNSVQFTICQCPFLFSLGMKISILEYETRRLMEYSAEQAFLKALDRKQVVDVYLKIRVRREFVTTDSLRSIQSQQKDLKKSLRIEFVNEPGIDAGGLRKEWFLLLTRDLFNPNNGLFVYVPESRVCWFSIMESIDNELLQGEGSSSELYYLFGVVLGLAIYNSTILDLKFPRAFYKKICGEVLSVNDFLELYPETGTNMLKMLEYDGEDFEDIFALTFETCFPDCFDETKIHYRELCPNGSTQAVTRENKHEYFRLWMDFYLNRSIAPSFQSFRNGFFHVIEGNSFRLFGSEELEQLVCGSSEQSLDVRMLRSVTRYQGGFDDNSPVVQWFWEILSEMDYPQQRKLLHFVTGSDRVPATGVTTIPFRISRIRSGADRLPLSHTCFNEICLHEYKDKETLRSKLIIALEESQGYGFR
ncbi:AaceriAEL068Wp [[Ashbya] aceris (nom. inval.)]|nr:AaceriAEL068Wp [[Ashbya] aceris (nom. inval.)]